MGSIISSKSVSPKPSRPTAKKVKSHKSGSLTFRWLINSLSAAAIMVLVSLVAFAVVVSSYYYETVKAAVITRARTNSGFFSKYYTNSYTSFNDAAVMWASDFNDKDKLELQFIDSSGRISVTSSGPATGFKPQTPDIKLAVSDREAVSWVGKDPLSGERVLSVSAPLLNGSDVIAVMRFVSATREIDAQILRMLGYALIVGVVFLAFVTMTSMFFISGIRKPIKEINEVTKRIASGRYGARIDKSYKDEIGDLIDSINHMSSEISAAERMKSDFISSVSHELRTPLTAIGGWGETLLSADINDPVEIKKGVRIMLKETRRLTKMVEELLEFTRMEGGRMTLQVDAVDIGAEFEEVVYMMMDAMSHDGVELTCQIEPDLPDVMGDRARLKQVFFNILDNAAKHGKDGKKIDSAVYLDENMIIIRIRDYGAGIPASELPLVKKKFYKGSTKGRGSGIGLTMSDDIVTLHGGKLDIESEVGKGTTVYIQLPIRD